jgi:HAD superfamily phosphoserine phosphatase-like hydrolase
MNVYDFDNTIYKGDSTRDFYFYCLKKHPVIALYLPVQGFFAIPFALHLLEKTKFKEKFYGFFKFIPDIDEDVKSFWIEKEKNIKDFYYDIHRSDDLIISASPQFLLSPICEKLDVKLMASRVDKKSGKYSGLNCYGEEKVRRFCEKFKESDIEDFYSDSLSDTPLAKMAKRSFIVKGDDIKKWQF